MSLQGSFPFPIGNKVSIVYSLASSIALSAGMVFLVTAIFDELCFLIEDEKKSKSM